MSGKNNMKNKYFPKFSIACLVALGAIGLIVQTVAGQEGAKSGAVEENSKTRKALVATDFASLQAALDSLPDTGGVITIPANTEIRVKSTIKIAKNNVVLRGEGRTSILSWGGGAAPVVWFGRGWYSKLENLRIIGGFGTTEGVFIKAFRVPGKKDEEYHAYVHAIELNQVTIEQVAKEGHGVRIGDMTHLTTEAEVKLRDCVIDAQAAYGVRVSSRFACNILIDGCYIQDCTKAGIYYEGKGGGPFIVSNCCFGINDTDIITEKAINFNLLISGCFGAEGARHLYVKHVSGGHPNITIVSTSIHYGHPTASKQTDGIKWEGGGSLVLINSAVNGLIDIDPQAGVAAGEMRFFDIGNRYGDRAKSVRISPKVATFSAMSAYQWGQTEQWISFGLGGPHGFGSNPLALVTSPSQPRGAMVNVRGISSTGTPSNNLRGVVEIPGDATSAKVNFTTPEPDAEYFPLVQAVGATRVYVSDISKQGFTVNTETTPGNVNAIKVGWLLVR